MRNPPTSDWTELAPTRSSAGMAVLLPGRRYGHEGALLAVTARSCLQAGWAVRQVVWGTPEPGPGESLTDWVCERAAAAMVVGPCLVAGKSLGTRAATYAAAQAFPAIWLTPLLNDPSVVRAIRANPARQLLVGGTADPHWDVAEAAAMPPQVEVMEIDGADHLLGIEDDVVATTEGLVSLARRTLDFMESLTRVR